MATHHVKKTLLNFPMTKVLGILMACLLGHAIESLLGINFSWGVSVGLALSYPYGNSMPLLPYLVKITGLASIVGLEVSAISATGILDFLIKEYRSKYLDTQIITAVCVVLLLAPLIDMIVKYILQPLFRKRMPQLFIKIMAATMFGIFIGILNKFNVISFVVRQCRNLNIEAHLVTAICVMFILIPINDIIGKYIEKMLHH